MVPPSTPLPHRKQSVKLVLRIKAVCNPVHSLDPYSHSCLNDPLQLQFPSISQDQHSRNWNLRERCMKSCIKEDNRKSPSGPRLRDYSVFPRIFYG
ncbi:hypothetical protein TNIN_395611 [Trichonephila inaurata madagascariensis]|uniref:Uncharacterized protein n=1 Tax=Trichonephila inaurata madagascariensis TaxID=2747483 RepID=A0A8X6Y9F9_9ARAC|nr:hypothetical protein TNIN_395611 [Trichonephila inaurata madagascariensis]